MLDLLKLEAPEAERLAYAEGFKGTAELFARIADLEAQVETLEAELEDIRTLEDWENRNGAAHEYKQFFYDCFEHLAGRYPAPSVMLDYDKSVIFDAIAKGAAE